MPAHEARVTKQANVMVSKTIVRKGLRVRVPPRARLDDATEPGHPGHIPQLVGLAVVAGTLAWWRNRMLAANARRLPPQVTHR